MGIILVFVGVFNLIPILYSLYYDDGNFLSFLFSTLLCLLVGGPLTLFKTVDRQLRKREGYLIVALGWLGLCVFGALPYLFSDIDINFANAFFESSSGFTTTGATIFDDIESLPESILIWRSLSQWIGAMGIIVFTVAIFPILGIGGVELFTAETPGPSNQKLHPRIAGVAKRLWLIYAGLTVACFLLLTYLGGMTPFDAINHTFTTMATGGYSTKDASIGFYNSPIIEYIIMIFIFISGTNYTILYYLFKGRWKNAWASEEFRFYLKLIPFIFLCGSTYLYFTSDYGVEEAFRYFSFNALSIITTTGYVTADYTSWGPGFVIIFLCFIFMGACAGSTSGAIKMIRHLVFIKNGLLEFKRILHPRAIIRLKLDGQIVKGGVMMQILVFLLFYIILFVFGTIVMATQTQGLDQPFITAVGAAASCLSNVGPAIGDVGPVDTFAKLNDFSKVFLSILMIIGRLEIFTILILFTTYFWKNN